MRLCTVFCVLALLAYAAEARAPKPLSDEMVFYINHVANTTWKAGPARRFESIDHVKKLLGTRMKKIYGRDHKAVPLEQIEQNTEDLPDEFDARDKWGDMCPSVRAVRDQSNCGSCWAFGAATAMSDRLCIQSKGTINVTLSAADLLSCCDNCGSGCDGGYPAAAWQFWNEKGLVTGGEYGDEQSCKPYPFPKCDHHVVGKYPPCKDDLEDTPACHHKCSVSTYKIPYKKDKHFGGEPFSVPRDKLREAIFKDGPVEAAFTVYDDFPLYKSGVYQPTSMVALGGHAIRIIGWGKENGVPYWLIANSWNEDWGDKGYFKILRGQDTCGIESEAVAAMAKVQ